MDVHLFHNFKYVVSISAFWMWDIYILKFLALKLFAFIPFSVCTEILCTGVFTDTETTRQM